LPEQPRKLQAACFQGLVKAQAGQNHGPCHSPRRAGPRAAAWRGRISQRTADTDNQPARRRAESQGRRMNPLRPGRVPFGQAPFGYQNKNFCLSNRLFDQMLEGFFDTNLKTNFRIHLETARRIF